MPGDIIVEHTDFIAELMKQRNVSLLDIERCHDDSWNLIIKFHDHLKLREEADAKVCIAALRILTLREKEFQIVNAFCSEYNIKPSLDDFFLEKNKALIICALHHNPRFFSGMYNRCLLAEQIVFRADMINNLIIPEET
jgi:hypothetical protein